MTYEDMLNIAPYSLDRCGKEQVLTKRLLELTAQHRAKCREYAEFLDSVSFDESKVTAYEELPFLPVRVFKERELCSVPREDVVKIMTSSGTSGQKTSKIYLDRTTSANQQKTMVKIVSEFTGHARCPMIIIDCPSVVKDRNQFSARGAGILGFSMFGSKKIYALDDDMHLNIDELREFVAEHGDKKIFMFGFTFMVWKHFYKELARLKEETGETLDLSNAVLIHGGGWKKLVSEAVSEQEFHDRLESVCGLHDIHDYYGMVEQTGCIYMQCECGHLHASVYSDVIVRRPSDFSVADVGEAGIIQVVSAIPESYAGHSLLTEDEGVILGEDDCPCGRKGKYFKVLGRLKNAELRGCSDTYAAGLAQQSASEHSDVIENVTFLVGDADILKNMAKAPVKPPFHNTVVQFMEALSGKLMNSAQARSYPDIVSFGFFIRKSSVKSLYRRFINPQDCGDKPDSTCGGAPAGFFRVGRGVAFHIAPSNVAVNFAYSLAAGLLTGNANVVRLPSKGFAQVGIICDAINSVLKDYPEMRSYICLVRYERDSRINDYLSQMCDVRIIWGGDDTIAQLRKSALPPRAGEITFADRYSLAVIDADEYMGLDDKDRLAQGFYNDTYLTDQNACTSPRAVVWLGAQKEAAKADFWGRIHRLAEERYAFSPVMAVDKLTQLSLAAMSDNDIGKIQAVRGDNILVRVKCSSLSPELMDYRAGCGYFYEYDCDDCAGLKDFCNDTRCQTVGVVRDTGILTPLIASGIKGVDRVVPIGHTMDFDLDWDGYNLVERLTRTVVTKCKS